MSKRRNRGYSGRQKTPGSRGTLVGEVAAMVPASQGAVVARVDNDILGYQFPLTADCSIEFLDTKTMDGMLAAGPAWSFSLYRLLGDYSRLYCAYQAFPEQWFLQ